MDAPHRLEESIQILQPVETDDGQATTITYIDFGDPVRARYIRKMGSEAVEAHRLQGKQPTVIIVGTCAQTRAILPTWRLRDTRSGEEFNISGFIETEDHRRIEILAIGGNVTP